MRLFISAAFQVWSMFQQATSSRQMAANMSDMLLGECTDLSDCTSRKLPPKLRNARPGESDSGALPDDVTLMGRAPPTPPPHA